KIYPHYRPLGTVTGRISCQKPNIQQLPTKGPYRRCIAAPAGWRWVSLDLSQIELNLAAHLAGDRELLQLLHDGDVYAQAAAALFDVPPDQQHELVKGDPRREFGKVVMLGAVYGLQFCGFYQRARARELSWSESEARRRWDALRGRFPVLFG